MSVTAPPESYNIESVCIQTNRRALLNVPPPRFTPISPYPQYSQFQLDMRRKGEILKYKANATNTKTNNFTKAQLYSMLVNGTSGTQYTQEQLLDISNGIFQCDGIVMTPTSSSDVPGPVMNLFLDPSIPLYNYAFNNRNYGIINSVDDSLWTTYTSNDILFLQNVLTELFTLYIHNNITRNYYTYSFQTSVAISIVGGPFVNNPANPIPSTTPIIVSISNVYLYVYYNSTLITSNDPNVVTTIQNTPLVQNDFLPLSINVTNKTQNFSAVFFSGLLNVSNLLLFTQPGFVYDVKLQFGLTLSDNNFTNIQVSAYCNVSTYNNNIVNCTLLSTPSTDTNSGFVFSG